MRILGIDPGLARVGYGVIDVEPRKGNQEGSQQMIDCGIIRTDPGRSEGERMVEIARDLNTPFPVITMRVDPGFRAPLFQNLLILSL